MENTSQPNVEFYLNNIPSEPDGDFIENILTTWKGDYNKLEKNCAYIQWLFPNKVAGKNPAAFPLTEAEAEVLREHPQLKARVKKSFEMMLDFFGMELFNNNQFKLTANSDERLKHLNVWGSDSFLQINRILLALKELGYKDLMLPWMRFLANLIYKEKKLDKAESNFEQYWMETLHHDDYEEMQALLDQYKQ